MSGPGDTSPIRSVLIVGGGIVGWSAAAAIRKRLPAIEVSVLDSAGWESSLAERVGCALPSIHEFHGDIGLPERDALAGIGSGLRLGTRFSGWRGQASDYIHAYGPVENPFEGTAFHQQWVRLAKAGRAASFLDHSAAAAIAESGRVAPTASGEPIIDEIGHGLRFDPARYRELMQAYAQYLGARRLGGQFGGLQIGRDGFIETVTVEGDGKIAADLIVDASGASAVARGAMDDTEFEDWSGWLSCDRLLTGEGPPAADIPSAELVEAHSAGWQWRAESPAGTAFGFVYSSAFLSAEEAAETFRAFSGREPEQMLAFRQGRLVRPWLRNCVAIGDCAVGIEPLEWTNLHLAQSAIDRMVSMMPDRNCSEVELADYNRQVAAEADRVRDFVLLHYVTAHRPEPFWQAIAGARLPISLAHTLLQFRERGRLPFYEEETFARDSWLAVLLGQGEMPRRVDPVTDLVPIDEAQRASERMRETITGLVPRLPFHTQYLQTIFSQANR